MNVAKIVGRTLTAGFVVAVTLLATAPEALADPTVTAWMRGQPWNRARAA